MEPNKNVKNKVKFFKITSLDKVTERANLTSKRDRKEYNTPRTLKKVETLKKNTINSFNYEVGLIPQSSDNSIYGFLNACHSDLRKFIDTNEWIKINATPHELLIVTRNKFRITIGNISRLSKSIKIKDNKGKIIFDGTQTTHYK